MSRLLAESARGIPRWFLAALIAGLAIRLYLVFFTRGTYDIDLWTRHAQGVATDGLQYYHQAKMMNQPPFVVEMAVATIKLSVATGIPFRILWRLPFALLDAVTALLLLGVLRNRADCLIISACYWLHPLAIIFSSYHGNTDSSVALFLMLCLYLLSWERTGWAGVAAGISLWIKLTGALAIPAAIFWLPTWRHRLKFILAAGVVAFVGYLPAALMDPEIIYRKVLAYQGFLIQTTGGTQVWGTRIFFPLLAQLPPLWQSWLTPVVGFCYQSDVQIALAGILVISWLRRWDRTPMGLGATIAAAYTILYGLVNAWSFQYFACSVPFWFFAGWAFAVPASLLAGGYIYSLYWFVCGNPWLLGLWDFRGHPNWPPVVEGLRTLCVLFFLVAAVTFIIDAVGRAIHRALNGRKKR